MSHARDVFSFLERQLPLILALLAGTSRLVSIDAPPGVVFDEFHFGRFVNDYHAGTYLFDIHPPLGKLVLYISSYVAGYHHDDCSYDNIHDEYAPSCKFVILRTVAAFFGALSCPVLYLIVRNFRGSARAAFVASLLFIFDGLNAVQSRFILLDSQLIFWCALALLVAQLWWARWNAHWAAVDAFDEATGWVPGTLLDAQLVPSRALMQRGSDLRSHSARTEEALLDLLACDAFFPLSSRLGWSASVGFSCACAVSIKFTGLATPGMIAVESAFAVFFLHRAVPLFDLAVVLASAALTYAAFFVGHFALLPSSGSGDAFMSVAFQRTLLNSSFFSPAAARPSMPQLIVDLNRQMLLASARIEQRHQWDSVWWEWVFNLRGVLYYSKASGEGGGGGDGRTAIVYLLGNPAVSAAVVLALFTLALQLACFARYRTLAAASAARMRLYCAPACFCAAAYVLNLVPYAFFSRLQFIYHYMPALLYGEMLVALVAESVVGGALGPVSGALVALPAALCWVFYVPWYVGLPLTRAGHAARRWLMRWN